jgi:poly(A) polymerase
VHVHYGDNIIETSTFRCEPPEKKGDDDLLIIEDNEFGTAEEDAQRRDFTVNALFLNPNTYEIHDWVQGMSDLESRLLRTIGDPMVRLAEDPVRILRAVKFATRLDFEIEEGTWQAMVKLAEHLGRSAPPRVLEEILRLLRSGSALGAMKMLRAAGGLRVIFPDLDDRLGERDADDHEIQQRAALFWRLLEALDQRVHSGLQPSNALLLAVLFAPLVESSFRPEHNQLDRLRIAEGCLASTAERARLAKRDTGRAARILANHPLFVMQPEQRFSPLLFALTSEFEESLAFFGLRVQARGKGWDVFEAWEERLSRALQADEEELEEERKRVRGRRRNRRPHRGGRGRSQPG